MLATAARAIMERVERIVLSRRDSERVPALLETPPEPTPALKEAARRLGGRSPSVAITTARASVEGLTN